jgi:hypothetical protein
VCGDGIGISLSLRALVCQGNAGFQISHSREFKLTELCRFRTRGSSLAEGHGIFQPICAALENSKFKKVQAVRFQPLTFY